MTAPVSSSARRDRNLPLLLGLVLVLAFFGVSGVTFFRSVRYVAQETDRAAHTHDVILAISRVRALVREAESGQRGYLLTGSERYLEPFTRASAEIATQLERLRELTAADPQHRSSMGAVQQHVNAKLAELNQTIALRRAEGPEAARALVETGVGEAEMRVLDSVLDRMQQIETATRAERLAARDGAQRDAIAAGIVSTLVGIALTLAVAWLIQRTLRARRRQEWLQGSRLALGSAILGEQRLSELGGSALTFLAREVDAHAGALFAREGEHFRRLATCGVAAERDVPERFAPGEGLLGQAAAENRVIVVRDVPEGYLSVGSALGRGRPRQLVIAPAGVDGRVNAVLELGFVHPLPEDTLELLAQSAEALGVAIRAALYRENLQALLEETQRQAEELQAQSEELRVNNEELEEQSRALRESQARLEQQQAELEQTNSQLEEQTHLLEVQRNDLERATAAVQAKADELERASRYKSDFLANMSHELRTPLNSSLILSKLLADNPAGNLNDEQVRYAETIYSAGNDLLALINDILDLSKIEAGHMEIHHESVDVERLVADLARGFDPIARDKGLTLTTRVEPACPPVIETDRKRLDQILRNLLSNALKFTESGTVDLTVGATADGMVSFAVRDTGIGIAEDHQRDIFEAFQQADGTISRRYGGTGLGLSISRELARLLGGAIRLQSKLGEGSTFTLLTPALRMLPADAPAESPPVPPAPLAVADEPREESRPVAHGRPTVHLRDDRESLAADDRSILVVEDDESFARILYDLAHELRFRCLLASTAEDALAMARQYLPSAILLDVGLPDHSGLSVLDRLKRDGRTRHIPVHVISANDYARTALSLGAVGYLLKPVRRDDLVEALRRIETRFDGRERRVLIVEDDAVQRDSLSLLLGSEEVEAIAVGTAAQCLERLREATFDCMVLDLSLPDASGYSLLETLSQEDAYSFPPVIVYTGRELSGDEEQRLRRYSKSIIIKGAKSPERLLDEVTLFLHRVVSELPPEQQRMLEKAHNRDAILEGRRILVVEDDVRNVYALTGILEPRGALIQIARNGREALSALEKSQADGGEPIDLVLMDVMMPEMDGLTATRELRKRPEWRKLPVIMLTAKAMRSDQERCLEAGANDYMAKPLDVDKLLSLVRVWMPR